MLPSQEFPVGIFMVRETGTGCGDLRERLDTRRNRMVSKLTNKRSHDFRNSMQFSRASLFVWRAEWRLCLMGLCSGDMERSSTSKVEKWAALSISELSRSKGVFLSWLVALMLAPKATRTFALSKS